MNNYEYIIASLPVLEKDGQNPGLPSAESLVADILEQCSEADRAAVELLLAGMDGKWGEEGAEEFYRGALQHPDAFIRDYFAFDLRMRNAKVSMLNHDLGRSPEQDLIILDEASDAPSELAEARGVFSTAGLMEREKAIDGAYWKMAEEAVMTDVFSLDIVLSFIARLHIVERWLALDERTGREMFTKLLGSVRGNFKGFQAKQTS